MPNYCENDLTIHGSASEINRMLKFIKGEAKDGDEKTVLDFNKVIPYPEQFAEMDKRYKEYEAKRNAIWQAHCEEGQDAERKQKLEALLKEFGVQPGEHFRGGYNSGGYDWCITNWGTKWNACEPTLEERDQEADEAIFHFDTAWVPPIPVIDALAAMFPALDFYHEYYEHGMAFCGSARYSAGLCEETTQGNYYGIRGG